MISDAEIDVEVEQILARVTAFRRRLTARPEHGAATAIGFLDVGLEAAQNAIQAGHRCMQAESGLPPIPIDYEVEYGMTALWRM